MRDGFLILIADRNRHVREFLQRELTAEGFLVQVAKDGREVLAMITEGPRPDLLILDLDIPYAGGAAILQLLQEKTPRLPIVIHTFLPEYSTGFSADGCSAVIEKSGNTDCLKAAVLNMLEKAYPERFEATQIRKGEAVNNREM